MTDTPGITFETRRFVQAVGPVTVIIHKPSTTYHGYISLQETTQLDTQDCAKGKPIPSTTFSAARHTFRPNEFTYRCRSNTNKPNIRKQPGCECRAASRRPASPCTAPNAWLWKIPCSLLQLGPLRKTRLVPLAHLTRLVVTCRAHMHTHVVQTIARASLIIKFQRVVQVPNSQHHRHRDTPRRD
jgi:hypothetical protein